MNGIKSKLSAPRPLLIIMAKLPLMISVYQVFFLSLKSTSWVTNPATLTLQTKSYSGQYLLKHKIRPSHITSKEPFLIVSIISQELANTIQVQRSFWCSYLFFYASVHWTFFYVLKIAEQIKAQKKQQSKEEYQKKKKNRNQQWLREEKRLTVSRWNVQRCPLWCSSEAQLCWRAAASVAWRVFIASFLCDTPPLVGLHLLQAFLGAHSERDG